MQNNGNSEQPVLIVAGMHRSGTSLTASLLQSAGLDIGRQLLEGNFSNVKGHFENLDFFNFHREALFSIGLNDGWTAERTVHVPEYYVDKAKTLIQTNASLTKPWGWKDPRTTLFLNFWGDFIPTAKFLLLYRSPWEVIDSLYRRGDITFHHNPKFALDVWTNYNQIILDFYNRFPEKCLLAHLKQVVDHPTAFIELLSQRLSIPLNSPAESIYDVSLLKTETSSSQRAMLIQRYFPDAYMLYQELNAATGFSEHSTPLNQELLSPTAWLLTDWLDLRCLQKNIKDEVTMLKDQLFPAQEELAKVNQRNQLLQTENRTLQEENCLLQKDKAQLLESKEHLKNQFQSQLDHQQAEIAAMKTSKFWRLRSQWFKLKALLHLKE